MAAKPLYWRPPTDHPQDGCREDGCILVSEGIGGRYHINSNAGGVVLWWAHDNFLWEACASVEEAKQKAESDWQRRYRARALEPTA